MDEYTNIAGNIARPRGSSGGPCKWEGCETSETTHGYCHTHYMRIRYDAELEHLLPEHARAPRCRVTECQEPSYARDMCRNHYHRWLRGSNPDTPKAHSLPLNKARFDIALVVRGMTRADIAMELGITRQGLERNIHARCAPHERVQAIAAMLGVSTKWLGSAEPPQFLGLNA